MRKPMLQAVVMAGVTVAGFWISQHGLEMPNVRGMSTIRQPGRGWVIIGLGVIAVGVWFGLRAGIIAWMRKELIDNEEAIARWTVSPADWAALTGGRAPASDVPVVVDTGAVVIGDACTPIPAVFSLLTYTQLASIDWVENGPGMGGTLVFARLSWAGRQRYINFVRAPVPEGARGGAQAAIDALDPLISADVRERAESLFGNELGAARTGGADNLTWALARRLMGWGAGLAALGIAAWVASTLPVRPGEASSAAFWEPVGITAFAIGMVLLMISLVMSR